MQLYKTTLTIDGMKCGMCEAHVNDIFRKNITIKKVKSSYKKKQTIIYSEMYIAKETLQNVLSKSGYIISGYKSEVVTKRFFL